MTGDFYECPKCGWRARLSDVDIRTRCSCGRMVQLPAATAPNPRAWAVATALAGDADWARWARGETMCPTTADEMRACGWAVAVHNDYRIGGEAHTFWLFTCGDKATCGEGRTDAIAIAKAFASANGIEPVPAPWDADAYRADAARRGVEPGPMPSLHGRTVNGLDWCVFDNAIEFRSGTVKWFMRGDELQVTHTVVPITREQWVEIGTLATAAKRAMGT